MITCLTGKLIETRNNNQIVLEVNNIFYEISVPTTILKSLTARKGQEVTLHTYHYLQEDGKRLLPVLIGFEYPKQKEFFELFVNKVPKMGPKGAVKALARPFRSIARAIEEGDYRELATLPGIGEKTAKQIIAALQGQAWPFAMIQDEGLPPIPSTTNLEGDALEILFQLGYRRGEAQAMVRAALEKGPPPTSAEELIQWIYRQKQKE